MIFLQEKDKEYLIEVHYELMTRLYGLESNFYEIYEIIQIKEEYAQNLTKDIVSSLTRHEILTDVFHLCNFFKYSVVENGKKFEIVNGFNADEYSNKYVISVWDDRNRRLKFFIIRDFYLYPYTVEIYNLDEGEQLNGYFNHSSGQLDFVDKDLVSFSLSSFEWNSSISNFRSAFLVQKLKQPFTPVYLIHQHGRSLVKKLGFAVPYSSKDEFLSIDQELSQIIKSYEMQEFLMDTDLHIKGLVNFAKNYNQSSYTIRLSENFDLVRSTTEKINHFFQERDIFEYKAYSFKFGPSGYIRFISVESKLSNLSELLKVFYRDMSLDESHIDVHIMFLNIIRELKYKTASLAPIDKKQRLINYLSVDEPRNVIKGIEGMGLDNAKILNEVVIISSRLHRVEEKYTMQLIKSEEYYLEKNKVNFSLLKLLDSIFDKKN